ncbi:MAG: hypothetical protein V1672_03365 [Candidatus Diapherotrites archaeon]
MALKLMNQKGQEFSAFKLLISAIVAVAILAILIPLLTGDWFDQDPNVKVKQLIGQAVGNPSAIQTYDDITFKNGNSISAASIMSDSGLSSNQVCMGINKFENQDFRLIGGASSESGYYRIIYDGGSDKKVKVIVLCDTDSEALVNDIVDYSHDDKINTSDCDICEGQGSCCAVMLDFR